MNAAHILIAVEPWFQICRTKVPILEPVPSSEPRNRFQEPVLPSLVKTTQTIVSKQMGHHVFESNISDTAQISSLTYLHVLPEEDLRILGDDIGHALEGLCADVRRLLQQHG